MTIIATMLYGKGLVAPRWAVESVLPWVDLVLVLDSGIEAKQLSQLRELAGEKFRLAQFEWPKDFGGARNFSLEQAERLQGSWAVTVDADEALRFPGYRSQAELLAALNSRPEVQAWMVPFRGGEYAKDRFIRLPTKLRWQGVVHEYLGSGNPEEKAVLPGAYFDEEPKSPEALDEKLQRDRAVLEKQVAENPKDARAWMYLGRTLETLDEREGSINAYLKCAQFAMWREEGAWAHFKAASGFHQARQYERGLQLCVLGRQRRPIPELAWLAGHCCLELGRYDEALEWGRQALADVPDPMAALNGEMSYFKFLPAWFEAPHDLMRQVYLKMKLAGPAEAAKQAQLSAIRLREEGFARYYPNPVNEPPRAINAEPRLEPFQKVRIQLLYSKDESDEKRDLP